jgi:hypothetical protein
MKTDDLQSNAQQGLTYLHCKAETLVNSPIKGNCLILEENRPAVTP